MATVLSDEYRHQNKKEEVLVELPTEIVRVDYSHNYLESTRETLVGLYSKREVSSDGTTVSTETVNDIIWRVATSVAIAELRYKLTPQELLWITLEQAVKHPAVIKWAMIFADQIGNQIFWANTPANINAEPEVSLNALKYWASGVLCWQEIADCEDALNEIKQEHWIWNQLDVKLRENARLHSGTDALRHHERMMEIAVKLQGKGTLAACGVTSVHDNLESIQEAARVETLAAKCAMGMGINTSRLRPWSTPVSNGAAASGPDRFYEKTISKSVEAIAQGGRRGGALIELRNSDHPDILFFIDKKALVKKPVFAKVVAEIQKLETLSTEMLLVKAEEEYGRRFHDYLQRQDYLKNTNITVLAMPGFMQAVRTNSFYRAQFNGADWSGPIYDPRKRLPGVNKLTKENLYERYSIELRDFPEALEATRKHNLSITMNKDSRLVVDDGWLYAPDVMRRIADGMRFCGEPGMMFYEYINGTNANAHEYDLDTCNPCGEQVLPSGNSKQHKGMFYAGTCNLSSMKATHADSSDFEESVYVQQRFMDNVTDVSWYPIAAQNFTARAERRNGGGFAGVAEFLSRQCVEFGSEEALKVVAVLYKRYVTYSLEASKELAKERGAYMLFQGSEFDKMGMQVRNSCTTTNAPTGTLAQALQTTWGVDPHYGIVFSRKVRSRFVDFTTPAFEDAMRANDAWPVEEDDQKAIMSAIRANNKSCRGLSVVPLAVQKLFPVKSEVSPEAYIRHLGAIYQSVIPKRAEENGTDYMLNSISNTCAIPEGTEAKKILDALFLAYDLKVKALTFYPDGSRISQPVEQIAAAAKAEKHDLLKLLETNHHRQFNMDVTIGSSYKVPVGTIDGVSTLHVSLNESPSYPGELVEIYARMGKSGAIEGGLFEAVGRLASAFLQYAAKFGPEERKIAQAQVVKQLIGIQSGYPMFHKFTDEEKSRVLASPCDSLAQLIQRHNTAGTTITTNEPIKALERSANVVLKRCNCGGELARIDGCTNCTSCGYSKC